MKKKEVKVVNKGIDTTELMKAIDELEKVNGIKKDFLLESIQSALVIAYKKNFDCNDENVKVILDKIDGQMHVYQEKDIVEKVEDDKKEISLEDAQKINTEYKIGDKVEFELMPKQFGRIAAQTARQIMTQKIREASRDVIFNEFEDKKGEIITGLVQKADGGTVIMDLGRIEGIMPKKQQIPTEYYRVNDKVRACIINVEKGTKGSTKIILSRSSDDFVRKLFEIEIPEIYEGVIEIKGISRDPGSRCKVAVYSPNPNIDPVGSCVGQKGIRIQNIINELNGEKIDVIEWNEDPSIYISAALLPAKVLAVDLQEKEGENFAQVIVPNDQLSLAIGKAGQNARLAANLTNWKIDIKSEAQFREILEGMNSDEEEIEEQELTETEEETIEKDVDAEESEIDEVDNNSELEETEPKKKTRKVKETKKEETEE